LSSLANKIQHYINELLANSKSGYIEIQRSKLASKFLCVPSQINYVLNTRFSIEQGYIIESQQGGGGYLRIIKLPLIKEEILKLVYRSVGDYISEQSASGLLKRLQEEGFLTKREMILMRSVISKENLGNSVINRDMVRAKIIKAMLVTLMRREFQNNK
jgi:transcriptional regulator CtsR